MNIKTSPSGYESFGIAFLEAWATRKPVIGCRRGAVPSVVSHGRDGLLVAFQNPATLADAIILLLKNPHWARALGASGHNKVMDGSPGRGSWRRFREVYSGAIDQREKIKCSTLPDLLTPPIIQYKDQPSC